MRSEPVVVQVDHRAVLQESPIHGVGLLAHGRGHATPSVRRLVDGLGGERA